MGNKRVIPLSVFFWLFTLILPIPTSFGEGPFRIISHDIKVEIDPSQHTLRAEDLLEIEALSPDIKELGFYLNRNLKVEKVEHDGGPLSFIELNSSHPAFPRSRLVLMRLPKPLTKLRVVYQGEIYDPVKGGDLLRFVAGADTSGMIGEEGVYLKGETNWYPDLPESLSLFNISISLPPGWEVVTQGELVARGERDGKSYTRWLSKTPADSLALVAGRFIVASKKVGGVEIYTYLKPENAHLSDKYIGATSVYLEFYSRLLGPYPYERFAIVENFFPSGHGLPSFTLLGSQVIRRLYVQPYALGHEIVHSWWGNYVFPQEGENWAEAITTYLANYYYREVTQGEGEAVKLRRRMLQEYSTYVGPARPPGEDEDYPLARFREKKGVVDQAIGYQKGAMIFHMMRRMLGDARFFQALKSMVKEKGGKRAGWIDFQRAFEEVARESLSWFFNQWVREKGAPHLYIDRVEAKVINNKYQVSLSLHQGSPPFRLLVPILVEDRDGRKRVLKFQVSAPVNLIEFTSATLPKSIIIDPGYDLFRRLKPSEMVPNLNLVIYDPSSLVIYPKGGGEVYRRLAGRVERARKLEVKSDEEVSREELKGRSLFILGGSGVNKSLSYLTLPSTFSISEGSFQVKGRTYEEPGHSLLISFPNPLDKEKLVTIFLGNSEKGASAIEPLLFFYGWESYIIFKDGKPIGRGDFPPLVTLGWPDEPR